VSILRPDPSAPAAEQRRGAIELSNVRPVERRRPVAPGAVDPALAEIAQTKPGYTTAKIDGRPVQIFIERDRFRWWKLAGLVALIVTPIAGLMIALASAASWVSGHGSPVIGFLALVALVGFVLRRLNRAGVCCPGLHCSGCSHR
jgi:hypothetical protein